MPKPEDELAILRKALDRLQEALDEPEPSEIVIDGTLQRFEFVIELYWRTLRHFLTRSGVTTGTPRDALKEAYRAGWINNEDIWIQMIKDRNLSSHLYNERVSRIIHEHVKGFIVPFEETYRLLLDKFGGTR